MNQARLLLLSSLVLLLPCWVEAVEMPRVVAQHGMVVSVSREASEIGRDVLRDGGSAVDAAVATALAMAVTFPEAGNIGGGGFMMVYPGGTAVPVCIEYRETAPAACQVDTFINETRQTGHKVVGVPGTVRGLALAHQKFGRRPWRALALPAVRLARDGFAIDAALAAALNSLLKSSVSFPEFMRVFSKPGGGEWREGDKLVQGDLAETMQRLADEGPDGFYRGRIAEQIVAEMQKGNGYITHDDLRNYQAHARVPIHGTYRGYDIYGPPPPSSGGIVTVGVLNILEKFDLPQMQRESPEALHLIIEATKRMYCDRARFLGDPDFVAIPELLTNKAYALKQRVSIQPNRATPSEQLAPDIPLAAEGENTTHFSVVDAQGMAVSNTYTLQNSFGSKVVVRGAGFLLNNEMTDFNWRPGVTDRSGRIGTKANQIAPGKRMLSSQSPTIVARDGKPVLVTGSPGGRTIPNTVLSVVLGVTTFGLDVRAAVDAPRLHHQWLPDEVKFERAADREFTPALDKLRDWGHKIDRRNVRQGDAHSIMIVDGKLIGAADGRRTPTATAAGY